MQTEGSQVFVPQISNSNPSPSSFNSLNPDGTPKRKRGRPPKNQEGLVMQHTSPKPGMPSDSGAGMAMNQSETGKRPRGRPPGSKNKVIKSGPPLIPTVVNVNSGEDIVEKLREIAKSYKRSLVVLAATGTLSTATLMQVGAQGAILQNAGSEFESKTKLKEPTVFLSASLANPTGGVVGGTVAGNMEASAPVQLVIGHWDNLRLHGEGEGESHNPTSQPSSSNQLGMGMPFPQHMPMMGGYQQHTNDHSSEQ